MQATWRFLSPRLKCSPILLHIPFPCMWLATGARVGGRRAVVSLYTPCGRSRSLLWPWSLRDGLAS